MDNPIYCHNCGHRMISGVYCYDADNRKNAWLCTTCGRLIRFLKMQNGTYLPVPIWPGRIIVSRRKILNRGRG